MLNTVEENYVPLVFFLLKKSIWPIFSISKPCPYFSALETQVSLLSSEIFIKNLVIVVGTKIIVI